MTTQEQNSAKLQEAKQRLVGIFDRADLGNYNDILSIMPEMAGLCEGVVTRYCLNKKLAEITGDKHAHATYRGYVAEALRSQIGKLIHDFVVDYSGDSKPEDFIREVRCALALAAEYHRSLEGQELDGYVALERQYGIVDAHISNENLCYHFDAKKLYETALSRMISQNLKLAMTARRHGADASVHMANALGVAEELSKARHGRSMVRNDDHIRTEQYTRAFEYCVRYAQTATPPVAFAEPEVLKTMVGDDATTFPVLADKQWSTFSATLRMAGVKANPSEPNQRYVTLPRALEQMTIVAFGCYGNDVQSARRHCDNDSEAKAIARENLVCMLQVIGTIATERSHSLRPELELSRR